MSSIPPSFSTRPKVAILREQGVNGHAEMAFGFHLAGFSSVDVHMTDIINGDVSLDSFVGIAACGGFSYGDVLGAGNGWAKSVLLHKNVREEFHQFLLPFFHAHPSSSDGPAASRAFSYLALVAEQDFAGGPTLKESFVFSQLAVSPAR